MGTHNCRLQLPPQLLQMAPWKRFEVFSTAFFDEKWNNELPIAIKELFTEVVKLGGTISGEHGIGLVQKQYMPIAFPTVTINLMRSIKKTFDPNGILNPGKIF